MYTTREVREESSGRRIATLTQTTVLRGNGGFGGSTGVTSIWTLGIVASHAGGNFKVTANRSRDSTICQFG